MISLRLAMAPLFGFLNQSFGNRCLLCQQSTARLDHPLCHCCFTDLPAPPRGCQICGEPMPNPQQACGRCQKRPPHFQATYSRFPYHAPVRGIIAGFKFSGDLACGDLLGRLLASHIRRQRPFEAHAGGLPAASHDPLIPPLLLPVPLHRERLKERQFNQSQLLAGVIANELKLQVASDLCRRIKATQSQRTLNIRARAANVRNAFQINRPLNGETIAIVDDVMTTGATVNEIARQLKKRGAGRIEVWCLARAAPPR